MKNVVKKIIGLIGVLAILVAPLHVFAATGTVSYSATSMDVNETKNIKVILSSADDVQAVGGSITSADSSCVKVNSVTAANGNVVVFGNKFAFSTMSAIPSGTEIVTVNVTGLKNCVTKLSFTDTDITSTSSVDSPATISAADITVGGTTSKSNNNKLSSLTVSKGSLSPEFSAGTTSYRVDVANDVDSINIGATAEDSKASISGTGKKSLSVGSNTVNVVVTAEDGSKKTYNVVIVRAASSEEPGGGDEPTPTPGDDDDDDTPDPTPVDTRSTDNSLRSLEVSGYSLEPGFDASNQTYSLTVGNDVTSLDISAIANDEKASVSISGNDNLSVGVNNIDITVTAEDGSQRVYTIRVVKNGESGETPTEVTSKSSENRLKNLIASEGAFNSNFNPNTNTYSMTVASDVDHLNIIATPMDSKASVRILNNEGFVQGETKVVSVIVTAEDGSTRTYTINVKKSDKEADTKLKDIKVSGGTLSPKFDPDTSIYTTEVGSGTKSIYMNATPANPNSKVEYSVNGGDFTTDGNLDLEEGSNIVVIKVTDENGLTRQYIVNVERDSSSFKIFGIKIPKWLGYLLLLLLLLLIGWLIFLLLKRRKKKEEAQAAPVMPTIEIKPEFNFNSKNEDNDKVEDGGILNQNSAHANSKSEDNDTEGITHSKPKEIPYDPYDDIVTKEEIIDAINEKDSEKLKILYKQEMLNREKEKVREKEKAKVVDYEESDNDEE